MLSVAQVVFVLALPLAGYITDRFNMRLNSIIASVVLLLISHAWMYAMPDSYYSYYILLPMAINRVGYSFFLVSVFSSLQLLVKSTATGIPCSIQSIFQNMAILITPIFIGLKLDFSDRYCDCFVSLNQILAGTALAILIVIMLWHGVGDLSKLNPGKN